MALKRTSEGYYNDSGKKLPRVTNVIGKYDAEGLIHWSSIECGNHIFGVLEPLAKKKPHMIKYILEDTVANGKGKWKLVRNSGGDRGTELHSLIEMRLKGKKIPEDYLKDDDEFKKILTNIDKWREEWGFEPETFKTDLGPLAESIEVMLESKEHGYAGTCDAIGTTKDGRTILFDIKTGKTTKDTIGMQLAAYAHAWVEQGGKEPDLCFVLHVLPSGNLKEKIFLDKEQCHSRFEAFLGLLRCYKEFEES